MSVDNKIIIQTYHEQERSSFYTMHLSSLSKRSGSITHNATNQQHFNRSLGGCYPRGKRRGTPVWDAHFSALHNRRFILF